VRVDHEAARRVDRYLRVRARHPQAYRSRLWLGVGDRGPLTRDGIYQMVKRPGDQVGAKMRPHRFRHHFSQYGAPRGGGRPDGAERLVVPRSCWNGTAAARGARARRHHALVIDDCYPPA
jgi:integrase